VQEHQVEPTRRQRVNQINATDETVDEKKEENKFGTSAVLSGETKKVYTLKNYAELIMKVYIRNVNVLFSSFLHPIFNIGNVISHVNLSLSPLYLNLNRIELQIPSGSRGRCMCTYIHTN
jgi:hypothetical protein